MYAGCGNILNLTFKNLSNENIYCIGDCSGMCRGLTTAASMGILCAEDILKNV